MANTSNSEKWYFTKEQLENTPSRKCGYDSYKELSYRQQAANFIQDMGQKLKVSQLCINTAIVYMHRFYVFHSFTQFPWHQMAAAALFLAAKVEEQPRKLEHVIRAVNICRNQGPSVDLHSERYQTQSQDLVFNENVLLQTLGFDVAIDHPHTHVVRCCHLVRASKDLAQTSYFMASNSLHLTTMCIQYKPTVVACFCILVACKWSNWEIPLSNEKKEWYWYVDPTVTAELLQQLTEEFLVIFENCPSRLKEKIMAIAENVTHVSTPHVNSPFDQDPKKIIREDGKDPNLHRITHDSKDHDPHNKHRSRPPHESGSSGGQLQQRDREYRERKERERLAAAQLKHMPAPAKPPHGHHKQPAALDPKAKQPHPRPPPPRQEPRDILREASREPPRADKNQRDYLLKPNASESQQYPSRPRLDANKYAAQQAARGRHEKHSSSAFPNKPPTNSTSQKVKSPLIADNTSKSVPKANASQPAAAASKPPPPYNYNGNSNGGASYNLPVIDSNEHKIKQDLKPEVKHEIKQEIKHEIIEVKKPGLFSPEKTPPRVPAMKNSPNAVRRAMDPLPTQQQQQQQPTLATLSPLTSPVSKRNRNYSSSSEPELRPVMKKIDQVEGFENIMRDSTIGINKLQVPAEAEAEQRKPLPLANGIETNPTLISNLLKETPPVPHLPAVIGTAAALPAEVPAEAKEKDHHHHKSKKKNKEKHKHKDKDRSRDDKEKKKKHKDKDKHKHKDGGSKSVVVGNEPIKIKIQKDKILPESTVPSIGLKIKIPRDKIKTEDIGEPSSKNQPQSTGVLKIKIPKDVINMEASGGGGKKRERSSYGGETAPPAKSSKYSNKDSSSKQNGRHSYAGSNNKVSNNNNHNFPSNSSAPARFPNHPPHPPRAPMPVMLPNQQQQHMPRHMFPPPPRYPPQMYPPPPPQMPNMCVPPPSFPPMYHPHQQFYNPAAFMYSHPIPDIYRHQPQMSNPPLPADAPPAVPPPPPPE
ncbi:unnamed protein product [Brassicogethes aeneus]|uniref:Cyclin-like domain-containing protein n=1 Tax=Brassicogethes aeneus TaxID=1431903 RepID=A0A9P0AY28_BRAAE|nr:unnamed protein product [Brassicogethes aeneus]